MKFQEPRLSSSIRKGTLGLKANTHWSLYFQLNDFLLILALNRPSFFFEGAAFVLLCAFSKRQPILSRTRHTFPPNIIHIVFLFTSEKVSRNGRIFLLRMATFFHSISISRKRKRNSDHEQIFFSTAARRHLSMFIECRNREALKKEM